MENGKWKMEDGRWRMDSFGFALLTANESKGAEQVTV